MSLGKLIPAGIVGTGIYLPEQVLTNADLEKMVDTSDQWIRTRTGIHERRILNMNQNTSDMAAAAAQMALTNAGIAPSDVDLILLATVTPDTTFPSAACLVQDKLGIGHSPALDIAAGCSGFVYGLSIGSQFIETGVYKTVLVIGAESLSRILNWEDRNTCVLFGDAAGAAVLTRVEEGYGILSCELGADGSGAGLLKEIVGDFKNPFAPKDCLTQGRYISMAGSEVFKFAVRIMGECALTALEKAGLHRSDIDCLIPHQANIRIIEAAAKRLELPMAKVFVNVHNYGNTSAASIPVALHEAHVEGRFKKGDIVVPVGFGAGLTWGATVIRWVV